MHIEVVGARPTETVAGGMAHLLHGLATRKRADNGTL